jgi:hypothetical protein
MNLENLLHRKHALKATGFKAIKSLSQAKIGLPSVSKPLQGLYRDNSVVLGAS